MKSISRKGREWWARFSSQRESMSHKSVVVVGPPPKTAVATAVVQPSEQDIAIGAHELFLKRGGEAGHELEDWLQAERELRAGKKS
jgi:hypothetical protein